MWSMSMIKASITNQRRTEVKLVYLFLLATLVFSIGSIPGMAAENCNSNLMGQVFSAAEADLGAIGPNNTLIITDIGSPADSYVYLDDFYSQFYGKDLLYTKNLLSVQNSRNSPLWFAFFDKCSGNCTYIEVSYENESKISYKITENIDFDKLSQNQKSKDAWSEKVNNSVFNGHEFAILTIANAWATEKLDYELMQCLEVHNHFCPGVSSGYVLANWMEKNYPLKDGGSYTVFACPLWCKDDVFVKRWDTTPGKGGIWVSSLTDNETEALGGSPAGIFVVTDKNAGTMKAVALGFNFDIVSEKCGIKADDPTWVSKYLEDLWLMNKNNWDTKGLVSVISVKNIDAETLKKMELADNNPYVVLGLLNSTESTQPSEN
jgi:formylmethanofuran dehydrogenase subunit E-like metal-binding protein